jgi:hypothetical protein
MADSVLAIPVSTAALQQAGDYFFIFFRRGGLKKTLTGEIGITGVKPFVL